VQGSHLPVGVMDLGLHQGDPYEVVPMVVKRQYVDGTARDVEHQPGQVTAAHQGQQLRDAIPLHHDLL